jgi:dipeptidyl aminopeptidase/acylaminoacyl peptidase
VNFFRDRRRVLLASSLAIALLGAVIVFVRSGDDGTTSLSSGATTTSTTTDDVADLVEETTTTTSTSTTLVPSTTSSTAKVVAPTTATTAAPLRGFGAEGWINYDISGEEHLVSPDGSGDYVLNTGITEPSWCPDHSTIIFASHAQRPGMYYVRADGVLHKYSNDQGNHRWPSCAADGEHVYTASFTYGANPQWTIHLLRLDGTDDHVVHGQTDQIDQVVQSPDGSTIAFLSGETVTLMNPDGSSVRVPPNSPQGVFWLDWTKDSKSVLFAMQGDIWKMNVLTGERTQLTSTQANEANPQVSPDGTMVAFSVETPQRGIDVMKLDGSQRHHIVDAPVYELAW